MNHQHKFWCVEGINLFDGLSPDQTEELKKRLKRVRYQKGETIYFPGDPGDTLYFLHEGRVKLAYLDESGRRLTLTIVRPGEPFGEMAIAGEEEGRELIAEALEDVNLCIIPRSDFLNFIQDKPLLSFRITKLIGQRRREVESKLEDLIFKDVPTRLSRLLLKLSEEYGQETEVGVEIDLKLTHQELADLIGSTRETTTAMLNRLEDEGILVKGRGQITIKNLEELRERAVL
ncbi:MAG: Crp/Fnr family transcriptional regulator [Candidatus Bipolaricaulia bacterium]